MDVERTTRTDVSRRLDRLAERYGAFPVDEETVTNDPAYFEEGREMARDGWRGDAGAFVTDDAGRALLIRHRDAPDRWGTPGGGHEPGESFEETARREVREETGVECTLTDVAWARRKTVVREGDPDARFHMLTVIFEGDYEGGEIDVGEEEILEAKWFSEPPSSVHGAVEATVEDWAGEG